MIFLLFFSLAGNGKGNHIAIIKHSTHLVQASTPGVAFAIAGDSAIHHRKHKFFAALLAFPFPLGVLGLHRIYLGTSTGVPFLYIATIGGALGILPFVDFMLILLCKDVNTYAHNSAVFMWTRKKK